MAIDRKYFVVCNSLGIEIGMRVRFRTRSGKAGEGTITLIWFGCEETVDVVDDSGTKYTLYPDMGDTIEPAASEGERAMTVPNILNTLTAILLTYVGLVVLVCVVAIATAWDWANGGDIDHREWDEFWKAGAE